ncbi:SIR2 family protein [Pseudarthrobacter sp. SL88]|uniref:SIR2 family NAD-dependent protein deacylase n=1 Tax=Pseudarthrobacter sp. SL88 TaxID=2994666 RepID=UPI002272BDD5|nr:SIR2 family protein [Pseudarthrobacter sp. SL88]MCY1675621.1 SIR2 family protein [Pseudarthrobacter sp. SL88]
MTQPHVFVAMADILNVRCDAWLLPTDSTVKIEKHWLRAHPELRSMAAASASAEFRDGSALAEPIRSWESVLPLPIMTAVPDDGTWGSAVVAERLEAFVCAALMTMPVPPDRRPYRLLALPFFGTAGGGAGNHLGAALRAILDASAELASRYDVDIVLVLRDRAAFSLAQKLRREASDGSPWPSLKPHLHAKAKSLGQTAGAGHLVPFLGAGVSVSAGAPSWGQLLDTLRTGVRLKEAEVEAFKGLGPLDQAGVLEQLYADQHGSKAAFGRAVAAAVDLPRYGLAPALLAALPSAGAITLNYDRLFEMACGDAQRPRTVMPENIPAVGNDWLLKLHGSVSAPESIVLTRDDYLGYNSNREALSALVKAHLLTHHLLFVGFGLADDHFHEIVHDVRRALPATGSKEHQMGTVLSLFHEPLQSLVWSGNLDILPMSDAPAQNAGEEEVHTALAAAGRELEIFLDMMASYATDNHSYLLAPAYDAGLNEAESRLRAQLMELAAQPRSPETEEVWALLDKTLERLGRSLSHQGRTNYEG